MPELMLHHVSVVTSDLERSAAFYSDVFDLERLERPPFTSKGAWFGCGPLQVHLIANPNGTRREGDIDIDDCHFAFRTDDFEGMVLRLKARGFREDADTTDPKRVFVNRGSVAGFAQLYLLDPDRNIIEINAAS